MTRRDDWIRVVGSATRPFRVEARGGPAKIVAAGTATAIVAVGVGAAYGAYL